jgi:hypothetical protein
MDLAVRRDMLAVIRMERDRRNALLKSVEPGYAYDQWLFTDAPLVSELCLILLVAVRHEVERELIGLAARVSSRGTEIEGKAYLRRLSNERRLLRQRDGWKRLIMRLNLKRFRAWDSSMEALRLLANCYKHDPLGSPDNALLKHLRPHLKYQQRRKYASLPESGCFREGVALSLGLDKNADYCDIAEEFLAQADSFLNKVKQQPTIAAVKWGPVSLRPSNFVC